MKLLDALNGFDPALADFRAAVEGDPQAVVNLAVRFAERRLDSERLAASSAAKGFAKGLFEHGNVSGALAEVAHLGAMASLLPVRPTRLDYAVFICEAILELKKLHPGGGFNSALGGGLGKMTPMVLAQSWAVLFNYGHLFGTYSTERMVLYELHRDPKLKRAFLTQIDAKLRADIERLIERQDLYRFHIGLAAFRVSRWSSSKTKNRAILVLKAYFESDPDSAARWLHRRGRRVAYNRIHSMADPNGALVHTNHRVDLVRVVTGGRLIMPGPVGLEDPTARLYDVLDSYHQDVIFAAPAAASLVLSHLSEFRRWWADVQMAGQGSQCDWIPRLFAQPPDWPTGVPHAGSEHVARFRLEVTSWVSEVQAWLDGDSGAWGPTSNFVLTPGKQTWEHAISPKAADLDVYTAGGPLSFRTARHVLLGLARHRNALASQLQLDLDLANFLASRLELHLPAELCPVRLRHADFGSRMRFSALGSQAEVLADLRMLAGSADDRGRSEELRRLCTLVEAQPDEGLFAVLICRADLVAANGDQFTDLDGVLLRVTEVADHWSLLEAKDGAGSGLAQATRLADVLTADADVDRDVVPGCSCVCFTRPG